MQDNKTSVASQGKCVEKCINSEHSWTLTPVLEDGILQEIPLVEVYVCEIADRKQTSKCIKTLNEVAPITHLQHLKRVHSNQSTVRIIVDVVNTDLAVEDCVEGLVAKGINITCLRCPPEKLLVPSQSPKTRMQFQEAQKHWPCYFHEDRYLENILQSSLFTEKDRQLQQQFMNVALKAAEYSSKIRSIGVGAVVVDTVENVPLAVSFDTRSKHPIQHAVMKVLDLVARIQGGGAWAMEKTELFEKINSKSNSELYLKRDNSSNTHCPEPEDVTSRYCDKIIPMVPASGPYLCTGYDVYVTREPCLMCAMALVHSRVRRVFYGCRNSSGALGSVAKIHTLKSMNHRFEVFCGILEDKCFQVSQPQKNLMN